MAFESNQNQVRAPFFLRRAIQEVGWCTSNAFYNENQDFFVSELSLALKWGTCSFVAGSRPHELLSYASPYLLLLTWVLQWPSEASVNNYRSELQKKYHHSGCLVHLKWAKAFEKSTFSYFITNCMCTQV